MAHRTSRKAGSVMTHPDNGDVVVRRKRGTPTAVYVPQTFQTMATRTYASVDRTFEITLSGTSAGTAWTVEHIYDHSLCCEIRVPGMDSIVASTEDAACARICDGVAKWLRLKT